ncbi:hypothetical protein GH714_015279 [Hevea brasiliensis]|uniref:Uncharacterized protein n=1 Tax=Hevea brasiliensis TaxID=3981 RepID=A0A6A6LBP2_HEVBR|nr:hypothetical protein GH714_015279 [Hevea brasiliensis]
MLPIFFGLRMDRRPESKLIDEIVNDVRKKINHSFLSVYDNDGLFGIDSRVKEVESLLCLESEDSLKNLKFVDLSNSKRLIRIPDMSKFPELEADATLHDCLQCLCIPGSEMPEWMMYKNDNGSSLSFSLATFDPHSHATDFIKIAFRVLVAPKANHSRNFIETGISILCRCTL